MRVNSCLISEVEMNRNVILIGDNLLYTDACNCERWIVTELFKGGFMAFNRDIEESESFYFEDLQIGWSISEKTKSRNNLEKSIKYK
jgi:hypothetical protein